MPRPLPSSASRRFFLLSLATASCVSLSALAPERARAQAGSAPHISEDDPLAKALGYKDDAAAVDKAKYPTFKAGQMCSLCRFYQGTAGQAFGPCQVLGNKAVNAKGWCVSFSAKT